MITRTLAYHLIWVIYFVILAGNTFVYVSIVEQIVRTYSAEISIVVRIGWRAIFTSPLHNIINLLIGTKLTFKISEIPILWMMTENTLNIIPIIILSLITYTFFILRIINLSTCTIFTNPILLILS